jgi:hypothetical protein
MTKNTIIASAFLVPALLALPYASLDRIQCLDAPACRETLGPVPLPLSPDEPAQWTFNTPLVTNTLTAPASGTMLKFGPGAQLRHNVKRP